MTKKLIKLLIVLIIILITWIVLFKTIRVQDIVLKNIYPIKYEEYVEKYAKQYEVDKYMIYAIIKAESNFKPDVTSHSDAIGLMQLLEDTAIERANFISDNEINISKQDLYQPEMNIQIGTSYFAYLLDYYKGNTNLALTAYNAGIGNVNQWRKDGIINSEGSDIENIPYKETNNYVRKILKNYQYYLKLYYK